MSGIMLPCRACGRACWLPRGTATPRRLDDHTCPECVAREAARVERILAAAKARREASRW